MLVAFFVHPLVFQHRFVLSVCNPFVMAIFEHSQSDRTVCQQWVCKARQPAVFALAAGVDGYLLVGVPLRSPADCRLYCPSPHVDFFSVFHLVMMCACSPPRVCLQLSSRFCHVSVMSSVCPCSGRCHPLERPQTE